jgi:hypothetical protein
MPDSQEVIAYLVPKPEKRVIEWLEDVSGYIETEAYS